MVAEVPTAPPFPRSANGQATRSETSVLPRCRLSQPAAKPASTAEQQEQELVNADKCEHDRRRSQGEEKRRLQRRVAQIQERLKNNGNDHRLDTVEDGGDLRQRPVGNVGPGEGRHDQRCRQDEADPAYKQPGPPGLSVPHVDRHFGGIRAGNQVGGTEQIQEFLAGQPGSATHDLVVHHGDVGCRATEADDAELQKDPCDGCERTSPLRFHCDASILLGLRVGMKRLRRFLLARGSAPVSAQLTRYPRHQDSPSPCRR